MIRICARCQEWIEPGEEYETRDVFSQSGPGGVIYLHKSPCSYR